uniref:NADH-ubiquinone oxidoreductase chain 4 n=1 Tax=Euplotes vanleeuwenhoeki TaxID=2794224 RepID=A0A7T1C591_9SPIT|nr:NADH-quinone oxidoreductase subunit M [Euplotes vanleeuwenhoeki]QPM99252.1 NADH-quinone oxidoreductase subunit M [Euplotes vanleeuwenhoeki]
MYFIPESFNFLFLLSLLFLCYTTIIRVKFQNLQLNIILIIFLIYFIYVLYAFYFSYFIEFSHYTLSLELPTFCLSDFSKFLFPFVYIFILITLTSLIYCFSYNFSEFFNFVIYVIFIFIGGLIFFLSNSLFFFFIGYESLLIPSFLILYQFAKTRKSVEAAYLMFFWTQFGALFLILNFQYLFFINNSTLILTFNTFILSNQELIFLNLTLLIGFGVKFPIWPFYEWLPKAHVEASTNFSIFLSGVLVKFAFFGYVKLMLFLNNEHSLLYITPYLIIGIVDSSLKLYYQLDLKKLVAYSTVLEMHWLLLAVVSGQSFMLTAAFLMLISHAIVSANFFLLVDMITRRFKTRLISEVSGLYYLVPNLYFFGLMWIVIFLGFPGTILFLSEFLFFSFLIDFDFATFIIIFIFTYLISASFFFKNWFNVLFNNFSFFFNFRNNNIIDLDFREISILLFYIIFMFGFSISFQFFIF